MSKQGGYVRRPRTDAKGRNPDRVGNAGRVLIIRRGLFLSPQWSALSNNARSLLMELLSIFNGRNRDWLFLSVRDAADRIGLSDLKAVSIAFNQLIELGFIEESIAASFRQKSDDRSRARGWRLLIVDGQGRPSGPEALPDLDFSGLTPRQKRAVQQRSSALRRYLGDYSKGKMSVEDSTTIAARKELAVEKSSTQDAEKQGKRPISVVEESRTHINYHRGMGDTLIDQPEQSRWWATVERCLARGH